MANNGSSGLGHVVMLLLLFLTIIFHYTESALPSDMQQLSITGRRMMAYYKPNGITGTPPSSHQGPGRHDRKLMSLYKPNGDIYTGPSNSGHGGGHIHQSYSP